jgi:hypothetical protein
MRWRPWAASFTSADKRSRAWARLTCFIDPDYAIDARDATRQCGGLADPSPTGGGRRP